MAYFRNVALSIEDFDSQEDYSRALLEQERIRKILTNVDITDAHVAKQLYEGFNQHPEMFHSIVGLEFMDVLKENSKDDDKPIEPFIYDNDSDEDNLDDTSADNIAEAEAIREESELMKPDNPEDMQQHNLQAGVTVESKEETKEAESDAASTDTAETTEDTPVEESDITAADTTGMTADTSSEKAVTEEAVTEGTVPENSETEAREAGTDAEPTDTAAMTEDTSSEKAVTEEAVTEETVPESSEIETREAGTDVETDTAAMTEDISSEEAVTEETVPESSEIEAREAGTDVEPTDTAAMTEDTSSEKAVTEEAVTEGTVPESSKQVTEDMADGKTDSTEETVKNNPVQSNSIQNNPVQNNPVQNNLVQSNTSQTKLTQADFAYAGLIKWVMVLYPFIIICFPMAGAILAGICAIASFIKIWGSYINNKMKTVDIFKSLLCIVIFPVGLILSVLGIMKKIKYVYYNRKAILYGCIMYMIPILFFLNVGIFSKNNMVSLIFPITKAFLDAAVLARIGIILDIIVVSVILIIAASVFAKRLIMIIQSYIDKGLTQNEAIYFVISLPIVMICMFKTFIDGKVLFEDKL